MNSNREEEDGFDKVLAFVRDELDPHIEGYTRSYLRRRVDSRVRRADCDSYEGYLSILREDGDERRELMDSFWINVTEFFRNPEVWELVYDVFPDDAVTASVGCADGRETYSLSMVADAKGTDATVVGTDIDPKAVEIARRGVYNGVNTDRFEGMSFVDDVDDYIEKVEEGYRVTDKVRENTRFGVSNAMEASKRYRFDIVLCRNLLIYVDTDRRDRIFDAVTGMLADDGFLVLGKTESLPADYRDVFSAVDRKLRIYRYEG
ncbi:MAG: CheR family methyltransferase [Halobacteria archaeon]